MLRLPRKILFIFLFILLLPYVWSLEVTYTDVTEEFLPMQEKTSQELINNSLNKSTDSTQSWNIEQKNLSQSEDKQQNSKTQLKTLEDFLNNQDDSLSLLEKQFQTLELQVETLVKQSNELSLTNQQLELCVNNCYSQITQLQKNLNEMMTALKSNKEDTGVIAETLGGMQVLIDNYRSYIDSVNLRLHRNTVVSNIIFPLLFISGGLVTSGVYCCMNDNIQTGKMLLTAGIVSFVGLELVWNSGHLALKFW